MSLNNSQASTVHYPSLVLIRGLPGSGKSYVAGKLAEALGRERVVLLDPDAVDYDSAAYKAHVQQLQAEGVDAKVYPYRFLRAQAYDGITSNKIVIWNQPFSNADMFERLMQNLQAHAAERGIALPTLIVEVNIDPTVAEKRIAARKQQGGHGPSHDVFTRFITEYDTLADRGYKLVTVSGVDDVLVSVNSILQAL